MAKSEHPRYGGRKKWPSKAARRWIEHNRCFHRWSVFVSGRDDRPWAYCLKCGALHPGER